MPREPLPKPARFVWPPRRSDARAGPTPARAAPIGAADGVGARALEVVRLFEASYLGVVRPSWSEYVEETGWAPDAAGAWCIRCGRSTKGVPPGESGDDTGCPACRNERLPWKRTVRLSRHEGVIRGAVIGAKSWRSLANDLGRELGRQIARESAVSVVPRSRIVIVPVPASFWRRMRRGVDHTLAMAKGVARELGIAVTPVLARSHRPLQTGSTLETRRRNVSGSMRPRLGASLQDVELVLLIDDVMTSGATMREACRALKLVEGANTPQIWACVASRAELEYP